MLNPLFKIILLGSSLMSMARCSVGDLFNNIGGDNNGGSSQGYNFISVTANNKGSANLQISDRLNGDYGKETGVSKSSSTPFDLYTFNNLPEPAIIDSEDFPYDSGITTSQHGVVYEYMKFTFYAKNFGDIVLDYKISFNITESGNGESLTDIMRAMVYENSEMNEHNYMVFAKASATPKQDEYGNLRNCEYISDEESGFAEEFENDSTICTRIVSNFEHEEVKRYTFVFWLEGYDPEASGIAPNFRNISFQINIQAKES